MPTSSLMARSPGPVAKLNLKFSGDRAAGVGILLSERASTKCLSHGSPCEQITWVRIKGPATNIFVIGC